MIRILAIDGSYRADGITDQVVKIMAESLRSYGAEVEVVTLRDYPIEFCLNCRKCTLEPGTEPGQCILHDGMQALIDKIEKSDGYILASPTNFGTVTAVYKRFLERLAPYAFWPWEVESPKFRKALVQRKKAVLVSSCAAPGPIGRWLYNTRKQLKTTAQAIGAETVGTLFTGLMAKAPHQRLPERAVVKARLIASRLV